MSPHAFAAAYAPEPAVEPDTIDAATGLAQASFGIGTYRTDGGVPFAGLVLPEGVVLDLSDRYADTHALFADWDRAVDWANDLAAKPDRDGAAFDTLHALPVLSHPNMLCAGSNYRQHVAEMMTFNTFNRQARHEGEDDESFFKRNLAEVDRRAREGMPFFWTGLHSSLAGANDDIIKPLIGEHLDWELEFGFIIGKSERYVPPEKAERLIAAYVMVNDIGTVDEFTRTDVRFKFDWVSKHQPNFKTFGPFAVPKQFVDRSKVQIRLKVNGEARQDWPISDMIFSPEQIVSYASERVRLQPGDLVLTGSPPGNGAMFGGAWLQDGDVVESEITYLGRQRNRVVAEETGGRTPTYGPFPTH